MNAEPVQRSCPEDDLAAAQARIRQLEEQLCETEQELKAASDIIAEQEVTIECQRLQLETTDQMLDEASEACRRLERRIADLEDDPCPVIVPVPQGQAPLQQPGFPPAKRPSRSSKP